MKHNLLAIDPATHCGWAVSNDVYGVWDLSIRKDESQGMKLLRLKSKLREIFESNGIDVIAYERPASQYNHSIIHQAKLIAIIEEFCEENNIEYRAYSAGEIKKFATGKGNANKDMMINHALIKLGYPGSDDNEADALWILNLLKRDLGMN